MWQTLFKPQFQNWRWALSFSTAIYFCLFVTFLEPFKGDALTYNVASVSHYLSIKYIIINSIMIVMICVSSFVMLPRYYPEFFVSEKFTFPCFIFLSVLTILGIAIANFFINNYFYNLEVTIVWSVSFFFKIAIPGIIFIGVPFVFLFLLVFDVFTASKIEKFYHGKENATPISSAIQDLDSENTPPQYKQPVMLYVTDNSSKNTLEFPLDSVYYITSAHNYIEIFHRNNEDKIMPLLIRNSLKVIEEEMITTTDFPLIRCHKAFISNREKIKELRGSAKTAQFILEDIEMPIPISRTKYTEFEAQFSNLTGLFSKIKP
jgi:LytTr DNA-binding domain